MDCIAFSRISDYETIVRFFVFTISARDLKIFQFQLSLLIKQFSNKNAIVAKEFLCVRASWKYFSAYLKI